MSSTSKRQPARFNPKEGHWMPSDAQAERTADPGTIADIVSENGGHDRTPDAKHLTVAADTRPDNLSSTLDASRWLGVHERTIRRWCESGVDGKGRPFKAWKEESPGGLIRWWVVGPLQRMDVDDTSGDGAGITLSEPLPGDLGHYRDVLETLLERIQSNSAADLHRAYGVAIAAHQARTDELQSRLNQAEDRLRLAEASRQQAEEALREAEASRLRAEADVDRLRNQGVFDRLLRRNT